MAGTSANYGYTLRRAKGAPRVAHSSRNIPLRSIFPLRPDTAQFWKIKERRAGTCLTKSGFQPDFVYPVTLCETASAL